MSKPNHKRMGGIDEWTAEMWYREFFSLCKLAEDAAESYAVIFSQNGMRWDMLQLLTNEHLKEMKICKVGHIIEILRAAQEVSSQEQRSEILRCSQESSSPPSRVINLKNAAMLKDKDKRKRGSEVGGVKRDIRAIKRPVPDEGPTLSVILPARIRPPPPVPSLSEENGVPVRTVTKERTIAQSIEVSSSTEKKQKRSVFERLGTVSPNQPVQITDNLSLGILKKSPVKEQSVINYPSLADVKLPLKPSPNTVICQSPARAKGCVSTVRCIGLAGSSSSTARKRAQSPPRQGGSSSRSSSSPPPAKKSPNKAPSTPVTTSFQVIVPKLSNPLVTKVSNSTPPNTRAEERRNFSTPNYYRRSNSVSSNERSSSNKQAYGSMASDQIVMSKGSGIDRDLKQRLGSKSNSWSKLDIQEEKKRVSFGVVRTKEIPAVPGTQPLTTDNALISKKVYTGSVALRTARRNL